jgi:hypothetical protein|tara:strand:+ start:1005 stop:1307 length:303 start_codon:yes stop_codon:yes gene_type:complete
MKYIKGTSGNPNGRPVGSVNKVNALKKELQLLLGDVLSEELSSEVIRNTLRNSSPSARLRFIEGCLKYMIPTMTLDAELDELMQELQNIKDAKVKETNYN